MSDKPEYASRTIKMTHKCVRCGDEGRMMFFGALSLMPVEVEIHDHPIANIYAGKHDNDFCDIPIDFAHGRFVACDQCLFDVIAEAVEYAGEHVYQRTKNPEHRMTVEAAENVSVIVNSVSKIATSDCENDTKKDKS